MKSYEMKPSNENIRDTFLKDTISRNSDLIKFIKLINNISDDCSIAIDGGWGSGKTFYVKQVQLLLNALNDTHFNTLTAANNNDKGNAYEEIIKETNEIRTAFKSMTGENNLEIIPQVCIYYDAWENDNDDDPILSLVYTIIECVDSEFKYIENKSYVTVAAGLLNLFTGRDWKQVIDSLQSCDPLKDLRRKRDIEATVKDFLNNLLEERGNRLVIIVDELDRCRPSFAVKFLERIKHYFENDRITFVFSVNMNELQHTIKGCYGSDFNGHKYLDRFFDLRISLNQPPLDKLYKSINCYRDSNFFDQTCHAVIKYFRFEIREIAKFMRLVKIAAYEPTHKNRLNISVPNVMWGSLEMCFIVPIIVGLRIHDVTEYTAFINGENAEPMVEILYSLHDDFPYDKFNSADESQDYILRKEKLSKIYEAIFNTNYSIPPYITQIGVFQFDHTTKDFVLRVSSLLSDFTSLTIL